MLGQELLGICRTERSAVVALHDQGRAVLGEQPSIGRLDGFGRGFGQRLPGKLAAAGQILDRQDPAVTPLDRLATLFEVSGPDRARLAPLEATLVPLSFAPLDLAITAEQFLEISTRQSRERRPYCRQRSGYAALAKELIHLVALVARGILGPTSPTSWQRRAGILPPTSHRPVRHAQAASHMDDRHAVFSYGTASIGHAAADSLFGQTMLLMLLLGLAASGGHAPLLILGGRDYRGGRRGERVVFFPSRS